MSARDDGAPVDLAAWRAEAGACAPLDAAATRDWYVDKRSPRSLITGGPIPLTHIEASRVSHCGSDGTREITTAQGVADIAFIAAARTGWPRDAARVAALLDMIAASEARVAAWRALAIAINDRRLSEGCVEDDEAVVLCEAHDRAWAEVQRVDPAGARRREAGAAAGCEVVLVAGREESK